MKTRPLQTEKRKKKIIELTPETFQKLGIMAVAQGKSLKAFIEDELTRKAEGFSIDVSVNFKPIEKSEADLAAGKASSNTRSIFSISKIKQLLKI